MSFDDRDRRQLESRGIAVEEVQRQRELLVGPPRYVRLSRPCTVGDGIVRLTDPQSARLLGLHERASNEGRLLKFVPASGAATRMFKELLYYHRGDGRDASLSEIREQAGRGVGEASSLATFLDRLEELPFVKELKRRRDELAGDTKGQDDFRQLLHALLDPDGLDYAAKPKGLLAFHSYPEGSRTPFEEHLVEAAEYARDADSSCRLHLTVSPEHREGFAALLDAVGPAHESRYGVRYRVDYSEQKPSTDTIAVDSSGQPLRDDQGRLLFRPGGHGALIENLADLEGDVVYVKNIDNVQPDHRRRQTLLWKRLLAGHLVDLQDRCRFHLTRLRGSDPTATELAEAARFAREELNVSPADGGESETARRLLVERLDRPLRVCGVVPNTGEPGGGPFWVVDGVGRETVQIVETAQVDPQDDGQRSLLGQATHFNPVDLVLAVRDSDGRPYDLGKYVDPDAVIVTRKSAGGRELLALERPGLWNGAMAAWNTVFVEVPLETFSPVKSVLDLLRPEHRPG